MCLFCPPHAHNRVVKMKRVFLSPFSSICSAQCPERLGCPRDGAAGPHKETRLTQVVRWGRNGQHLRRRMHQDNRPDDRLSTMVGVRDELCVFVLCWVLGVLSPCFVFVAWFRLRLLPTTASAVGHPLDGWSIVRASRLTRCPLRANGRRMSP